MLKSRDRSRSRDVSRPIFDGLGLGLEGLGLVDIPVNFSKKMSMILFEIIHVCSQCAVNFHFLQHYDYLHRNAKK